MNGAPFPPPNPDGRFEPQPPAPATPESHVSRRAFLLGGSAFALMTAVAGVHAYDLLRPSNPGKDLGRIADAGDAQVSPQEGAQPASAEAPRDFEDYSVLDLAVYAQTTEFAAQTPDSLTTELDKLEAASSQHELDSMTQQTIFDFTGRPLTINRNPGTDDTLPDTRMDDDLHTLKDRARMLATVVGMQPKTLVELPSTYNIIRDFLPSTTTDGRESIDPNIGGQVFHSADSDHLSLDATTTGDLATFYHELMHVVQSHTDRDDYIESSAYSQLRKRGADTFGSVADMHTALEAIRKTEDSGNNYDFYEVADLAYELIRHEDSAPDVRVEDEAYTLGTTFRRGLLPELTGHPLIDYLREKQIQAIADMSEAAGIDFGATIAFIKRFGLETHPKTLASLADHDVLQYTATQDASVLSSRYTSDQPTPLSRGSHIVDIGTEGDRQYVLLLATGTESPSINPDYSHGMFTLNFVIDSEPQTLDLRDTVPPTVPPTSTTVPGELTGRGGGEEIPEWPAEVLNPETTIAFSLIERFAPGIKPEQMAVEIRSETSNSNESAFSSNVTVSVNASILQAHIDRTKLVGRIGDDALFEKF